MSDVKKTMSEKRFLLYYSFLPIILPLLILLYTYLFNAPKTLWWPLSYLFIYIGSSVVVGGLQYLICLSLAIYFWRRKPIEFINKQLLFVPIYFAIICYLTIGFFVSLKVLNLSLFALALAYGYVLLYFVLRYFKFKHKK